MSMFIPVAGATLLMPSGPGHDPGRNHLFVLLSQPVGRGREVLLVSLSSIRPGQHHDPACTLQPGEHPFVKKPSFVFYARTTCLTEKQLAEDVQNGGFTPQAMVTDELLDRIRQGLLNSRFTPEKHKHFLRAYLAMQG